MKYIKRFENDTVSPQIGDYVICHVNDILFEDLNDFLKNNVGLIIDYSDKGKILVSFDDATKDEKLKLMRYSVDNHNLKIYFRKYEIKNFSKNIKDMELIINSNKYNEYNEYTEAHNIEIGDYVLVNMESSGNIMSEYMYFLNNNVGRFLKEDANTWNYYLIGYENVPPYSAMWHFFKIDYTRKYKKIYYTRWINSDSVIDFSKSKEKLQLKLDAKKYNL